MLDYSYKINITLIEYSTKNATFQTWSRLANLCRRQGKYKQCKGEADFTSGCLAEKKHFHMSFTIIFKADSVILQRLVSPPYQYTYINMTKIKTKPKITR